MGVDHTWYTRVPYHLLGIMLEGHRERYEQNSDSNPNPNPKPISFAQSTIGYVALVPLSRTVCAYHSVE